MRMSPHHRRDARESRPAARLVALFLVTLALSACGGGGGASGDSTGTPAGPPGSNVQAYSLHWQQPTADLVDHYTLSVGTRSGRYDQQLTFQSSMTAALVDGSLTYEIELDRSRDQFLRLSAHNASGESPPSNELRVPSLSAASASTATTSTAAMTARPSESAGATMLATASLSPTATSNVTSGADSTASAGERSGTLAGIPVADEPLRSLDLDGLDQFLATTRSGTLDPGGALSLSLWAKRSRSSSGREGLFRLSCVTADCALELVFANPVDPAHEPALELWRTDGGTEPTLVGRAPIPTWQDDWRHVAVTIDTAAGRATFYLDGALWAIAPSAAVPALLRADTPIRIALGAASGDDVADWSGRLGHAALFARALDGAAIERIAAGGHELDLRTTDAAPELAHYWRLGADAAAVGRDSGSRPLDLDDPAGHVDAAAIANDAPLARAADDDPGKQ